MPSSATTNANMNPYCGSAGTYEKLRPKQRAAEYAQCNRLAIAVDQIGGGHLDFSYLRIVRRPRLLLISASIDEKVDRRDQKHCNDDSD